MTRWFVALGSVCAVIAGCGKGRSGTCEAAFEQLGQGANATSYRAQSSTWADACAQLSDAALDCAAAPETKREPACRELLRSVRHRAASDSMFPTLRVNDVLLLARPARELRAGDVVVYADPANRDRDFVKRVVATPGDTLEMRDGRPSINGWQIPSCRVGTISYDEANHTHHSGSIDVEFVHDAAYLVFFDDAQPVQPAGPWPVNANEVFVLGDNRNNSHDSRFWQGGRGGGLPRRDVHGMPLDARDPPVLPDGADGALVASLAKCLRERPDRAKTAPPPPRSQPR